MKDIVIDTNVIRLYDTPADPRFKALFIWLSSSGTLSVSKKLLNEYFGTGNRLLAPLINRLIAGKRFVAIESSEIKAFTLDRHFRYTCNYKDRWHARLVFLTTRKRLVSFDIPLVKDVNRFRKVDGIKARACHVPVPDFYE